MNPIYFKKIVNSLPGTLEADTIYFVRKGEGFDIHVTNSNGLITAYQLNLPEGVDFGDKIDTSVLSDDDEKIPSSKLISTLFEDIIFKQKVVKQTSFTLTSAYANLILEVGNVASETIIILPTEMDSDKSFMVTFNRIAGSMSVTFENENGLNYTDMDFNWKIREDGIVTAIWSGSKWYIRGDLKNF